MYPDPALAYILSQTRQNLQFLVESNHLTPEDADALITKLVVKEEQVRSPPKPQSSNGFLFRARALWDYNLDDREGRDLKFREGQVVDITEETNADWWTGRVDAREGLFPANYVERIVVRPPPHSFNSTPKPHERPVPLPPSGPPQAYPYQQSQYPPPNPYYQPQPPSGPYPPMGYSCPPPSQPLPPPAPAPEPAQGKKPGFMSGGLKNTLAHSAVGGAGFGAGSAVAGGLINSIF